MQPEEEDGATDGTPPAEAIDAAAAAADAGDGGDEEGDDPADPSEPAAPAAPDAAEGGDADDGDGDDDDDGVNPSHIPPPWLCSCGHAEAGDKKRCGNCKAWKGGKRGSYKKKRRLAALSAATRRAAATAERDAILHWTSVHGRHPLMALSEWPETWPEQTETWPEQTDVPTSSAPTALLVPERRGEDDDDAALLRAAAACAPLGPDPMTTAQASTGPVANLDVEVFANELRSYVRFKVESRLDALKELGGDASKSQRARMLRGLRRDFPFLAEYWDDDVIEHEALAALGAGAAAEGVSGRVGAKRKARGTVGMRTAEVQIDSESAKLARAVDEGRLPRADAKTGGATGPLEEAIASKLRENPPPRPKPPKPPRQPRLPPPSSRQPPFELKKIRQKNAKGIYSCMALGCVKNPQANTSISPGAFNAQLCIAHHRMWANAMGRGRRSRGGNPKDLLEEKPIPMVRSKKGKGGRPKALSFEERLEMCRVFRKVHGNLDIPADHGSDKRFGLGLWAEKMREDYRSLVSGQLDKDSRKTSNFQGSNGTVSNRLEMLEELGFRFEPNGGSSTPMWDLRLEQCRRFKAEKGHLDILEKDREMSAWAKRMRGLYKKKADGEWEHVSSIEKEKVRALEALGFAFDGVFDVNLLKLKEFKEREGHCKVPTRYKPDTILGHWAEMVRREHNKLNRGEKSKYLNLDRLRKLNNIGFVWRNKAAEDVPWETYFEQLRAYREEHGKDPSTSLVGLGRWVLQQRLYYNKKMDGAEKHHLPDEREEKLRSIGFVFQAGPRPSAAAKANQRKNHKLTWDDRLAEFVRWKEKHGHPYVPTVSDGADKSLGSWVRKQRMAYRAYRRGQKNTQYGILNSERALKLVNAGFAFDASHIQRTPKNSQVEGDTSEDVVAQDHDADNDAAVPAVPDWSYDEHMTAS
ncbi:hypothetical protein ACHAWF_013560 [Thalassiosira exigua]